MRWYVIDEINRTEMAAVKGYLKQHLLPSGLENILWLKLPAAHYNALQKIHKECAPFFIAVELGTEWIRFELFVRSMNTMGCECCSFCDPLQVKWILAEAEKMFSSLKI